MIPYRLRTQIDPKRADALLCALLDIESLKTSELQPLFNRIGKESFKALQTMLRNPNNIEHIEREMKWPIRSGRVCFGLIADQLIDFYRDRKHG